MIIEASSFVFSFLFAKLTKEKVKFYRLSFLLFFIGIFILSYDAIMKKSGIFILGLIFAVFTSLTFGLYNSTLKYIRESENKLFATIFPVFLLSLPFTVIELSGREFLFSNVVILIIVLGFILTAIPYSFWAEASKYYTGFRLSEFFLLTLPGTFLIEFFWLGVSVSLFQIIASIILIFALILEEIYLHNISNKET